MQTENKNLHKKTIAIAVLILMIVVLLIVTFVYLIGK
jgi:uncharacterized membrane protein YvbJ